jgi:Fe-S oxidoreductase
MFYDHFVLPFSLGLLFLLIYVFVKFGIWIYRLPLDQRKKFFRGVFSLKLFSAMWEMITECLIHRRMYKVNPVLGFMHMSFAFGWFILIMFGNFETRVLSGAEMNFPYYPIFFKFFQQQPIAWKFASAFSFIMDLLLLYILSGLLLAFIKRLRSRVFGMKKTTRQRLMDRFALTSLWFIFPLRLLAESFTSGLVHNGSFMTGPLGDFFATFLPLEQMMYPAWWAYSISLGVFFVSVPFSRYMHIPTEVLLIAFRRFGLEPSKHYDAYTDVEVHSCPRCGVCIDKCQLSSAAGIHDTQAVYFIGDLRNHEVKEDMTLNCLMCGRCKEYCPVGIHTDNVRLTERVKTFGKSGRDFNYIQPNESPKADVIYFAGCMTHLTPGIKRAMINIFKAANLDYLFLDEDGSICCGRPLMLAGELEAASDLMRKNADLIKMSGAKTFVTSCPICYKVFNEEYQLGIRVLHHTQYLLELVEEKKLSLKEADVKVVYHDPCDLGRGSGIYEEPRLLLGLTARIAEPEFSEKYSLCCGSALGNLKIDYPTREKITNHALEVLLKPEPDFLITACPLCKKTFAKSATCEVMDVAEWVDMAVNKNTQTAGLSEKNNSKVLA